MVTANTAATSSPSWYKPIWKNIHCCIFIQCSTITPVHTAVTCECWGISNVTIRLGRLAGLVLGAPTEWNRARYLQPDKTGLCAKPWMTREDSVLLVEALSLPIRLVVNLIWWNVAIPANAFREIKWTHLTDNYSPHTYLSFKKRWNLFVV